MEKSSKKFQHQSFIFWMIRSAFSVGSLLFVLAAVTNTVTWYVQKIWDIEPNVWQFAWNKVLDYFGENEEAFYVYGTTVLSFTVYWACGLVYIVFDVTLSPAWVRRYKVQPGTNEPVILQVLFNQTVVAIPFTYLSYFCFKWRGIPALRDLPSFQTMLLDIIISILVEEVGFYYSHRLLHNRVLYKHIHKQHHEWTSPISITAVYCNPIEHVFSNLVPPLLGPLLIGSHIVTTWLWFTIALTNTLNAHSGYHFPFFLSPEFHDFHHLKFNQCFGVLGVLDYVHGTDAVFRGSAAFKRHATTFSATPLREQYPHAESKLTKRKLQ